MRKRYTLLFVFIVAAFLFVPWLGDTYFYSKGEPREAIVAVSMLQGGNWVLPLSYGDEMPYKPPFLAWLIAIFSTLLSRGEVTEFTARLPSALAAAAMLTATFAIVRRRSGNWMAWLTMLVCATSFEVMRAATACRVDMVLTTCMVGGIYAMFTMRGHPWRVLAAVLLLSGAVLTKGPVGALLPCLCVGLYMLASRQNFWRTLLTLTGICLASFIIPALWYWMAWRQGGDSFFALAWEENIGRLTGTMSYDSHINPWYYNVVSILAGMLPWTLPVLVALCYRSVRACVRTDWRSFVSRGGWPLLCAVSALTVFIFYCIPSSKRAVYLLPMYPFMAYGAAWVLLKIGQTRFIRGWAIFLAVVGIVASLAVIVIGAGLVPVRGVVTLHWWLYVVAVMPGVVGAWWLCTRSKRSMGLSSAVALTYALVVAYNASYMPMFLNGRSDVAGARVIQKVVPDGAQVVSAIPRSKMIRYYGLNYYLNDRLRLYNTVDEAPADAWVLTEHADSTRRCDTLLTRSTDTRRPVLLLYPR